MGLVYRLTPTEFALLKQGSVYVYRDIRHQMPFIGRIDVTNPSGTEKLTNVFVDQSYEDGDKAAFLIIDRS